MRRRSRGRGWVKTLQKGSHNNKHSKEECLQNTPALGMHYQAYQSAWFVHIFETCRSQQSQLKCSLLQLLVLQSMRLWGFPIVSSVWQADTNHDDTIDPSSERFQLSPAMFGRCWFPVGWILSTHWHALAPVRTAIWCIHSSGAMWIMWQIVCVHGFLSVAIPCAVLGRRWWRFSWDLQYLPRCFQSMALANGQRPELLTGLWKGGPRLSERSGNFHLSWSENLHQFLDHSGFLVVLVHQFLRFDISVSPKPLSMCVLLSHHANLFSLVSIFLHSFCFPSASWHSARVQAIVCVTSTTT